MKTTPSTRLCGVVPVVIGLITLGMVCWLTPEGESVEGVMDAGIGDGGAGLRLARGSGPVADVPSKGEPGIPRTGDTSMAELRQGGQYESLGAALVAARHAIEKIDPAGRHSRGAEYFAANPGEQLRAWFSREEVELASGIPADEGEEPWSLKLRFAGIGRGTDVMSVAPGVVSGEGSRIEVEHRMEEAGGDTARQELEPWSPRDRGRLARSGAGGTAAVPGVLPFGRRFFRKAESSGQGAPAVQGSGAAVTQWFENRADGLEQGFTLEEAPQGASGEVVLVMAVDGSLRAGAMEESDRVRFVDAEGAEVLHYTGLEAWDATGRILPTRMEVRESDSLALVVDDSGARYPVTIDPMFAHVEARLAAAPVAGDWFGESVAISGNTAVVGAPANDTVAGEDAGTAFVFVEHESVWSLQATLTAGDAGPHEQFGDAVSISGDTVLVGSPRDGRPDRLDAGSAYVFTRSGLVWDQQAKLEAGDAAAGDWFGFAVAISGDTAVVGAYGDDTEAGSEAGSAYVFVRAGTTWGEQARLSPAAAGAGGLFGISVALAGDTLVVGAPFGDVGGGLAAGTAHVFVRTGTTWSQQGRLTSGDPVIHDQFGRSVALEGDTALVGVPYDDTVAGTDAGSVQVFVRSGGDWGWQAGLTANDASASNRFGWALAISGEEALVGAPYDDALGAVTPGSACLFARTGSTWSQEAKLTGDQSAESDRLGLSVALSGDHALVGAPGYNNTASRWIAGGAYVFTRLFTEWIRQPKLSAGEGVDSDWLGWSVAMAGDTAVLGAPADDTVAGADAGSAYVFVRSESTWSRVQKLTAANAGEGDYFGYSVAVSGDTAVIGAILGDGEGPVDTGSAYVFVADGAAGWTQEAMLSSGAGAAFDFFGWSVAMSGDTAVVGAPEADPGGEQAAGSAEVFVRAAGAWTWQASLAAGDAAPGDRSGSSVALWGDTAVVGAPGAETPAGKSAGRATVFGRLGGAWTQQAMLTAGDAAEGDRFASCVALAEDTLLVGTPSDDTADGVDAGSTHVYVRDGDIWTSQAKLTAGDAEGGDRFGSAVALVGHTALIGAGGNDTTAGVDAGSAYVMTRDGSTWSQQLMLTAGIDATSYDEFGLSVALAGNTALVGTPYDDTAGSNAGGVHVFLLGDLPEITRQPQSRTVVPGEDVNFVLEASGYVPLRYQWRRNGYPIDGANQASFLVASAGPVDEGSYDCVVTNLGGAVTSAPAVLTVNPLSQFEQVFPGEAPEAEGVAVVTIVPSGIGAAWRFVGEQAWRDPGTAAQGLTSGDRVVEFRPVTGHLHPTPEPVSVLSGGPVTIVAAVYLSNPGPGSGGLEVILKPAALADPGVPAAERAQWRFPGEDESGWRDSGTLVTELVPGNYLVECKDLVGRAAPPAATVLVADGQTSTLTLTYHLGETPVGEPPELVPFETVSTSPDLPYGYVGQIRSAIGSGSGFVVKRRVVATAAHVVFDDGTLAAVTGVEWLLQRDRGNYDPVPQIPRGQLLMDGYAAQRVSEGTPGTATPASQELDVAAIWFYEDAGRGGYAGFLASDAAVNEWLESEALKTLVGYPVDGIAADRIGRMHATVPANLDLGPAGSAHTCATYDIHSSRGGSGGPLCVQLEGGTYYPAAIYIGGADPMVVRSFDGAVVDLFNRAELGSFGGENAVGGGITQSSYTSIGSGLDPGALLVLVEPEAARLAGAGWRRMTETAFARRPGNQLLGLAAGPCTIQFSPVAGFVPPAPQTVEILGGKLLEVTFTYAANDDDPDRDGFTNLEEATAGTDPHDGSDFLQVHSMVRTGSSFAVTTAGRVGRVYELECNSAPSHAGWTVVDRRGPLGTDAEVTLTDPDATSSRLFYRIRVSKP